jgi:hypothetical protein
VQIRRESNKLVRWEDAGKYSRWRWPLSFENGFWTRVIVVSTRSCDDCSRTLGDRTAVDTERTGGGQKEITTILKKTGLEHEEALFFWDIFANPGSQRITRKAMFIAIALYCGCAVPEKGRFLLTLFDSAGRGLITLYELTDLIFSTLNVKKTRYYTRYDTSNYEHLLVGFFQHLLVGIKKKTDTGQRGWGLQIRPTAIDLQEEGHRNIGSCTVGIEFSQQFGLLISLKFTFNSIQILTHTDGAVHRKVDG